MKSRERSYDVSLFFGEEILCYPTSYTDSVHARFVSSEPRACRSPHTARTFPLVMRPFTHGFVGRTATAVDGDVVWASATHDGASADTKTALERTSLEVIAKHSADLAGLYEMALPDVQRVVTLVKNPAYLPRAHPLYDATPLPSEPSSLTATGSSDRPRPNAPGAVPRVVFGVVVATPEAGGPSAKECAAWLDALANAFEHVYGGVAGVLARERTLDLAGFGRRVRAAAADFAPAGAADSAAALAATRAKMDEVRITMVDNIARVVERGERLDDVLAKSDGLRTTADGFRRTATRLKKKLFWANCKTLLAAVIFGAALLALIFFAACGGVACVRR